MLNNLLFGLNIAIALANGVMFIRCWRTMREIDRLEDQTEELLAKATVLKDEYEKLNR
jgi:hypothetical protein